MFAWDSSFGYYLHINDIQTSLVTTHICALHGFANSIAIVKKTLYEWFQF